MRLDEEQILTVTGGAPSLKLCQELTLTMLTTRGARPATPPGRQPEDGRSPHGEATGLGSMGARCGGGG